MSTVITTQEEMRAKATSVYFDVALPAEQRTEEAHRRAVEKFQRSGETPMARWQVEQAYVALSAARKRSIAAYTAYQKAL